MKTLVIFCHPEPRSFNGAMKQSTIETLIDRGDEIDVLDLYGAGFDPVEGPRHYISRENSDVFAALAEQRHAAQTNTLPSDVADAIRRLEAAELVLFHFPIWWHGPPAMLKGWFDRVFVSGKLYTSTMRYDCGYFRGRHAMCAVSTGAPADVFFPGGRGGAIDQILWPVQYSLHYMGFTVLPPFVAHGIQGHGFQYQSTTQHEHRSKQMVADWSEHLRSADDMAPIPFPGWGDWDDSSGPTCETLK